VIELQPGPCFSSAFHTSTHALVMGVQHIISDGHQPDLLADDPSNGKTECPRRDGDSLQPVEDIKFKQCNVIVDFDRLRSAINGPKPESPTEQTHEQTPLPESCPPI